MQLYTWLGLPLVAVAGWFYPLLGFLLIGCMLGALGIAVYGKGRMWCDWMCPRGSFFDLFLDRVSRKRKIPASSGRTESRIAVILALFAVLGTQLYFAWPDPVRDGPRLRHRPDRDHVHRDRARDLHPSPHLVPCLPDGDDRRATCRRTNTR